MYEIFGRMSVTKITFAYYELMELPDQYFGDFNLGSAYSRAGLWEAIYFAPGWHDAFQYDVFKISEDRVGAFIYGMHSA